MTAFPSDWHPGFGEIRVVNKTTVVVRGKDGFFYDKWGTRFGFCEDGDSLDNEVRLGVGLFSLPMSHPLTDAARFHDAAYSNPAYQATTPRSEADAMLRGQLLLLAHQHFGLTVEAAVLAFTAAVLGAYFWENELTRDL
jgi:hypothetical protein